MTTLLISGSRLKITESMLLYTYDVVDRAKANGWEIITADDDGVSSAVWWRAVEIDTPFTVYGNKEVPRNKAPMTNYHLLQEESQGGARSYEARNNFLVDKADKVMLVWDGIESLTIQTAQHARKQGKQFWLFGLKANSEKVIDLTAMLDDAIEFVKGK